jgi:phosphoglycerol transferase MdoB-like AlkP superfamily enzyme
MELSGTLHMGVVDIMIDGLTRLVFWLADRRLFPLPVSLERLFRVLVLVFLME